MSKNKKFYTPEDFEKADNAIAEGATNETNTPADPAIVNAFTEDTPVVEPEKTAETSTDLFGDERVVVEVFNCKKLNVRESPDGKASIIAVFPKGAKFHLIEDEHPTFYKIITDTGLIGYAMKDFLRVVSN